MARAESEGLGDRGARGPEPRGRPRELSPLTGELREPAAEAAFRHARLEAMRQAVRSLAVLGLVAAFVAGAGLYQSLGPGSPLFWWSAAARGALAGVCALTFAVCTLARSPRPMLAMNGITFALAVATNTLRLSAGPEDETGLFALVHVTPEGVYLLLMAGLAVLTLVPAWLVPNAAILGVGLAGSLALFHRQGGPSDEAWNLAYVGAIAWVIVFAVGSVVQRLRRSAWLAHRRLEESHAELERLATTDPLTGCANRRSFFARAERECERARRYGRPLALVAVDVDHFKRVNDRHGHAAGDAVLRAVVERIGGALRGSDLLGRVGGEEFALLLPETSAEAARAVAERLRRRIAEAPVEAEAARIPVTASFGMATLAEGERSVEPALARADDAVYRAKRAGRNAVAAAP